MSLSRTLNAPSSMPVPPAARILLTRLRQLAHGHLRLTAPDGSAYWFGTPGEQPEAELHIHDWAACRKLLLAGDIGFAEAFRDGLLDTPDPTSLLRLALRNETVLGSTTAGSLPARAWYWLKHRLRRNSRAGSRRNIHAHYDLGNEFYRLWLDPGLTYSSAWFDGHYDMPLAEAQTAKYQRICTVLDLRPGMRVLEIGCGWGGFAEHAAQQGIAVHGITISGAQLEHARQRLAGNALVSLEWQDYRDLDGRYDAIVSIEMFEAVGEAYWQEYFGKVRSLLKPGGKALVQSITIDESRFGQYRTGSDFIQEFIFPGGMLPSRSEFMNQARKAGLDTCDRLDFGHDYAETLRRWRHAFDSVPDPVRRLGFDEAFIRLWRLYLCYCEAGFDEESIGVSQFLLQEARP
ncbi:SAM-dependent methyltransferase [Laribacter hongkongensis]|uniref:SAM-dependent methyltransferase n=1 Tax=Laribacter hongkongensis TaxID=168471 RepID=UPI001EFE109F|nr:cyclopropane-fatty-acyl-phospholipid synthase family protein [Laribacter hongkongensis]MCG9030850.1 cyclopropane-fatty-acyl-phospholipid synthase family protein [Laribacter hongkongensis]MCG9091342.1 cyclopropane-fatty-acyl-phospholipid synthase family protein [Laribacter hongkongensis]